MFCPKCAAQNIDGASFCRVCGANISLVPQALSGKPLSQPDSRELRRSRRKRGSRDASIESALKNVFIGIAWLVIALALSWTGRGAWWWFWLLIPAFGSLGKGVAELIRYREEKKEPAPLLGYSPPSLGPQQSVPPLPVRRTGELVTPPASVTEGTTRHLGAEAPTRHLDSESDYRS